MRPTFGSEQDASFALREEHSLATAEALRRGVRTTVAIAALGAISLGLAPVHAYAEDDTTKRITVSATDDPGGIKGWFDNLLQRDKDSSPEPTEAPATIVEAGSTDPAAPKRIIIHGADSNFNAEADDKSSGPLGWFKEWRDRKSDSSMDSAEQSRKITTRQPESEVVTPAPPEISEEMTPEQVAEREAKIKAEADAAAKQKAEEEAKAKADAEAKAAEDAKKKAPFNNEATGDNDSGHVTTRGDKIPKTMWGVPYVSQKDTRYANEPYNYAAGVDYPASTDKTIETSGCGLGISASVVLGFSDVQVDMVDLSFWMQENGDSVGPYRRNGGTAEAGVIKYLENNGRTVTKIPVAENEDPQKIVDAMNQAFSDPNKKTYIILSGKDKNPQTSFTENGHWIAIPSLEQGTDNAHVLDPLDINLGQIPQDKLDLARGVTQSGERAFLVVR